MNEHSFITFTSEPDLCQIPLPVGDTLAMGLFVSGVMTSIAICKTDKSLLGAIGGVIEFHQGSGWGYARFSGALIAGAKTVPCFVLRLESSGVYKYSNPLTYLPTSEYMLLKYYCNETQFGFPYGASGSTYYNELRLPMRIYNPQFPQEEKIYVDGNGKRHLLTAKIDYESELETEYMTGDFHEKLVVALSHDVVLIEGVQFNKSGGYEIAYEDEDTLSCGTKIHKAKAKMIRNITLKNTNC